MKRLKKEGNTRFRSGCGNREKLGKKNSYLNYSEGKGRGGVVFLYCDSIKMGEKKADSPFGQEVSRHSYRLKEKTISPK